MENCEEILSGSSEDRPPKEAGLNAEFEQRETYPLRPLKRSESGLMSIAENLLSKSDPGSTPKDSKKIGQ